MLGEIRDWIEELACRAGLDGLPSSARMARPLAAAALLACGAAVAWVLWGGSSAAVAPVQAVGAYAAGTEAAESPAPAMAATVTVHVVGEVRRPGVYELAGGSRVRDAVGAAGGLLGAAEQAAVNLARTVVDGEQIVVPRQGETAAGASGSGSTPSAPGKVDLNTASAEQLDALPGIGPATAAKIIADRAANGPFRTVDDLMRVSGIGPAKFDSLKDLVRAN